MSETRTVLDVSGLPRVVFSHRGIVWWGTLLFAVIEGFTLMLMVASYAYLRLNEYDWPPGRTPDPGLLVPTINTVLLLLIILPMRGVEKAARRFDRRAVARGLQIATAMTVAAAVLRWYELQALQVRWDTHAYGSAAWALVVLHGTLILVDVFETGTLAVLFSKGPTQRKHYPDAADAAGYQFFLSLSWIPIYFLVYWGPRVL